MPVLLRHSYTIAFALTLIATAVGIFSNYFGHAFVEAVYNSGHLPAKFSFNDYLEVFDSVSEIFVIATLLLGISILAASPAVRYLESLSFRESQKNIVAFCLSGFFLTAVFAYFVLHQFPNSADEYSYLFEAMTFNNGHLWNPTHPAQEFFYFIHVIQNEGKWVSRFPPGWPIMLSIGSNLGIPFWLVNSVLGALVVAIFFLLANKIHNTKIATIATISLILSSFFIFNGASYFSHMAALLMVLLFYYHGLSFMENGNWKYALLAGLWVGFAFITRPYTAILISVPLFVYAILINPQRVTKGIIWLLLGASPFALFLFYYNKQITGDAFLMVTQWVHHNEGIGFVRGHTWGRAIWNTFRHLIDMMLWASPMLLLMLLAAIYHAKSTAKREDRHWLILEVSVFAILVVGYAFYWHFGGQQYGPRFYFEGYPFLLVAVTAWVFGESALDSKRSYLFKFLFVTGALWAIMYTPFHIIQESRVINERMDVYKLVEKEGLKNSIVLLRDGTGVIREMTVEDLTRNGISLTGNVIYGKDLGKDSYNKLREYFPDRKIYRYVRDRTAVKGQLIYVDYGSE